MIDVCVTKGYVPGFRRELNVRELGGYEAADGRRVKHGIFFRTAALGDFNEEELDAAPSTCESADAWMRTETKSIFRLPLF